MASPSAEVRPDRALLGARRSPEGGAGSIEVHSVRNFYYSTTPVDSLPHIAHDKLVPISDINPFIYRILGTVMTYVSHSPGRRAVPNSLSSHGVLFTHNDNAAEFRQHASFYNTAGIRKFS